MLKQDTRDFGHNPYSLLLIDLDHFKSVNDRFGHEAGDHMLRGLAGVLIDNVRDGGRVYRLGGEEFAVVVKPLDQEALVELAESLRARISAYRDGPAGSVTASLGVGTRRDEEDYSGLMRRVDRALYAAKEAGRDRVVAAE